MAVLVLYRLRLEALSRAKVGPYRPGLGCEAGGLGPITALGRKLSCG
jgi:hypothetical protein